MREFFSISAGASRLWALALLSLLMLGVALADEADPPGRVARLSYVQGSVSLEPAGQQDWIGAEINRPLTTNDKLWSDTAGSRAELDIGGAVIRLGSSTGFSFLNLDDNIAQMQVTAGTVIVHVRELLDNQTYEIDTPNIAVVLDQPGQYRVDVSDSGDSTVVRVVDGQAEATGGGQSMSLTNQQMVTFTGTDSLSADTGTLGAPDGFDDWSLERDREFEQSASRHYVAEDMAGAQDLDENGQWENTPDYGAVWIPTAVAVGWAPYSYGHWAWISPWGWTWVDEAPWGFAPFHYGRWARWHDSWCWVPGPRRVRPVYAPAMVAWVGGGGGAVGVGWFPLGPREVYVPGYHVSEHYVQNINITNTTIVNNTYITKVYQNRGADVRYANSSVAGAVTAVPRNVFTSAQPVNAHRVALPPGQLAHVSTTAVAPAIAPVRQSMLGGPTSGFGRRPPQAVLNRPVVARTAPPPAASGARVRLVTPPTQQAGRAPGFGRPEQSRPGAGSGVSMQQSRPPAQQPRAGEGPGTSIQPSRPATQQRPGTAVPPSSAGGNARTWADREHTLEQSTLPPSQAPRSDRPPPAARGGGEGTPVPNGTYRENPAPAPGRTFQSDRPPQSYQPNRAEPSPVQPNRVEQPRPPVNTYSRPPVENRAPVEERYREPAPQPRYAAPTPPPAPVPRFTAPAPPPAPVPHFTAPPPPPAPVRPTAPPPPQQHAPPPSREDRSPPPRGPGRADPPR